MTGPLVSVILPVYNGEQYIAEAIDSILNQQYENFEFLIINDCSPDNSLHVIQQFKDPRIRLIENSENLGLVGALNVGIENSKGKYLARMDQDDISLPDRLAQQINFMEKNPHISVVGANYEAFGDVNYFSDLPTDTDEVNLELHIHNCITHPTAVIRKEDLNKYNLRYNSNFKDIEDYGLWIDMLKSGLKFSNLESRLLRYRLQGQSTTCHQVEVRKKRLLKVHRFLLDSLFDQIDSSNSIAEVHYAFSYGKIGQTKLSEVSAFTRQIKSELLKKGFSEAKINALLKKKHKKLAYSIIKRNWLEGNYFLIKNGLLTLESIMYSFSRLNHKLRN